MPDQIPASRSKRTRAIALGIAFLGIAALYLLALYWPPARVSALFALRRVHGCDWSQAMEATRIKEAQQADAKAIGDGSHILQRSAGMEQWQTPRGVFWIPAASLGALTWDLAEQNRDIYGRGPELVRQGDVVLDCGANVGLFTRKALAAGASLVVAIEPGPENLQCLRRNFAREIDAGTVKVFPKGVWSSDMELSLNVDPGNSAADSFVVALSGSKTLKIPVTTIDKLVRELNLERVDFIKMDIEGSERQALQGARQTIATHRPRMALSAYHLAGDPEAIPAIVRSIRGDYRVQCHCHEAEDRVGPEVQLFF